MMQREDWHYPYFIDLQSHFTGVLDTKNGLFRRFWISFWIGSKKKPLKPGDLGAMMRRQDSNL